MNIQVATSSAKRTWQGAVITTVMVAIVGMFVMMRHLLTPVPSVSVVTRDAKPVVDAIHQFQDANGRPPRTIQDIVPNFLPQLPAPPANAGVWEYDTYGTEQAGIFFSIELKAGSNAWVYDSKRRKWSAQDNSF